MSVIDVNTRPSAAQWERARALTVLGLAGAAAAFAAALVSQYGFGLAPCPLCIWQRYPYGVGGAFALLALWRWRGAPSLRAALLAGASLAFIAGAGIGVFHSGVEFQWWEGLASCSAPTPIGGSTADFLEALKAAPLVRCDERAPFFLGLSMANWNVLVSLGFAACFAAAAGLSLRSVSFRGSRR